MVAGGAVIERDFRIRSPRAAAKAPLLDLDRELIPGSALALADQIDRQPSSEPRQASGLGAPAPPFPHSAEAAQPS